MASPEDLLISAVIRTGDVDTLDQQGLSSDMFTSRKKEWRFLTSFIKRHGRTPSMDEFRSSCPRMKVFKASGIATHADEVKNLYAHRAVTHIMDEMVDMMMDGDIKDGLAHFTSRVLHVQSTIAVAADDYSAGSDWKQTFDEVKARADRVKERGTAGIPSGFKTLDNVTGGFQEGWLITIGARLGQGKTFTMVKMACEAAAAGYRVVFFTLEQSRNQVAIRSHAFLSRKYFKKVFRPQDLMRGMNVDFRDYEKFLAELSEKMPGELIINDSRRGRVSPMDVYAGIKRTQCDIVFVDYLTLMSMKGDGGWLSVADLTANLKAVGEQTQIPIVTGSQLNRASGDGMSSARLSRSDSIGMDSDLVLLLQQQGQGDVIKMQLDKFRHGPDGITWYTNYDPGEGIYKEITKEEADVLRQAGEDVD